jgi:hypothetical protein
MYIHSANVRVYETQSHIERPLGLLDLLRRDGDVEEHDDGGDGRHGLAAPEAEVHLQRKAEASIYKLLWFN